MKRDAKADGRVGIPGLGADLSTLPTIHSGPSHALYRHGAVVVKCNAAEATSESAAESLRYEPELLRDRSALVQRSRCATSLHRDSVEVADMIGDRTATDHDRPDALRTAAEREPQVALLDRVMDGYELATRLREEWPDVKLVAITGYGQDSDRTRAHQTGFDAHFTKPVNVEALRSSSTR
jgi:CheY-like chemotaxis protein